MPCLAKSMACGDITLHDVTQQLTKDLRIALAEKRWKAAVLQVRGQRRSARPLPGVGEILGVAEWKYFKRQVPPRQFRSKLSAGSEAFEPVTHTERLRSSSERTSRCHSG